MNAKVSVTHPILGKQFFSTRDISDGGVFIVVEDDAYKPALGDCVEVQVQGLPMPAPVLKMVVARVMADGFGLQFEDE